MTRHNSAQPYDMNDKLMTRTRKSGHFETFRKTIEGKGPGINNSVLWKIPVSEVAHMNGSYLTDDDTGSSEVCNTFR
jgi:hypothetical protein